MTFGATAAQHFNLNSTSCGVIIKNIKTISESDNLGSTDSEVKKILTLHLPISEYDTLGSDSEGDGRATSQEMMSFSHRMRGEKIYFFSVSSIIIVYMSRPEEVLDA